MTGWRTNHPVWYRGDRWFIDVAFTEARIAVELDGWAHHRRREAFVQDRIKQNALSLEGWQVLRFTWSTLDDLVPQLRRALRSCA